MEYGDRSGITREIELWSLSLRYQMLDRMRADCDYYLGAGNRQRKYLWAGEVAKQIAYMKEIWSSFPRNMRPSWLSMAQICDYEQRMEERNENHQEE